MDGLKEPPHTRRAQCSELHASDKVLRATAIKLTAAGVITRLAPTWKEDVKRRFCLRRWLDTRTTTAEKMAIATHCNLRPSDVVPVVLGFRPYYEARNAPV